MNKYYCTFGIAHKNRNFVQPILAESVEQAESIMFEHHGKDWAFCYKSNPDETLSELPMLVSKVNMTTGEMFAWTNRLNNILSVDGPWKNKRLVSLIADLEHACDLVNDKFAKSLFVTVNESLAGYGS